MKKQLKDILGKRNTGQKAKPIDPVQYLVEQPGLWNLDAEERKQMSMSCRDTDYIPKARKAGQTETIKGQKVQIMHEGTKVALGGYHGEWMADIIKDLKGHHEPQEEKVFYEVLKRLKPGATMIEFGCFWAFYSLWFNRAIKNAKNLCCEPDPNNLESGKNNAKINNLESVDFLHAAAGQVDGANITIPQDSDPAKNITVKVRTIDSLIKEHEIEYLDLLHLDVQGFELDALQSSLETILSNRVRFIFVSTHHYSISGRINIHRECLEFIKAKGGHIISSHTVNESFSGDGLIVASFSDEDKDFKVETSINHSDRGLFRPAENDVEILAELYSRK